MAFIHGKNAKFWFRKGATMVDISSYLTSAGLPRKADTAETSTFGTGDKSFLGGMREATIPLEGRFDPTIDEQLEAGYTAGTAERFKYFPQGSASGRVVYEGSAFVTSYETTSPIDDTVNVSAELQVTGPVSRSVV